ncbi:MAG: hypothetical protein Q8L35_08250 [Actinomycetota bacterium]|nr:hypothetical protein [Actinomycetota bacterium]
MAWIRGFLIGLFVYAGIYLLATGVWNTKEFFILNSFTEAFMMLIFFLAWGGTYIFDFIKPAPPSLSEYRIVFTFATIITALVYGLIGAYINAYIKKRSETHAKT